MNCTDFRLDAITKDPEESYPVLFSFYDWCANVWEPNEQYDVGEYLRPTRPNGFAYQSSGGTSSNRSPIFPIVTGATVTDGSQTLTCVPAGANGLSSLSELTASVIDDLAISGLSILEVANIAATYMGGTDGSDYEVKYSFTLDGLLRIARQLVRVRKQ